MSADSSSPQPGAVLAVPAAGPIPVRDGSIGGAGELSYELAGDPSYQPVGDLTPGRLGVWAKRETLNVDDPPSDLDALELWGPEPTSDFVGDANKYSLQSDYDSFNKAIPDDAVSVWNGDANGTPFIRQSVIVEAVTSLLVPPAGITATDLAPLVDVDALMVQNMPGASPNVFDAATPHGPDMVIFSIRQIQIPDPADPDHLIYYATGSEIFWLEADGDCGFLRHGGHDWDKDYALAALSYSADGGTGVLDINALEAVAVPEPAALVLLLLGIVSLRLGGLARRRPA
jgi:hypothetical protein